MPGNLSSINASFLNVSIVNLTVNGTLFGGGSSGPNVSFTNMSVLGNFSMPSTAYMNVSNASFTNVSMINLTINNINGQPYTGGTVINSGATLITAISNVSNVNISNSSINTINISGNSIISQSPSNTTNGIFISCGSTMTYPTDATFTRITMAPETFMNVSNASFTNVSITNLTVNGTIFGGFEGGSEYVKITDLTATNVTLGNSTNSFQFISDSVTSPGFTYIDFINNANSEIDIDYDARILVHRNTTTTIGNSIMEYYAQSHDFYSGGAYPLKGNVTVNAATFNSTSDIRVKNIIRYITVDETLNFIDNTNPILFKWKDNNDTIVSGYIAQEVVKTQADHLVYTTENSDMKESADGPEGKQYYLNYDGIIPYHGVAIKHLLQENKNLKEEVKDLSKKNDELSKRIDKFSTKNDELSIKMNELSKELLQLKEMIKAKY
jgi:hypothetical protein